jgi:hypothetical protein
VTPQPLLPSVNKTQGPSGIEHELVGLKSSSPSLSQNDLACRLRV